MQQAKMGNVSETLMPWCCPAEDKRPEDVVRIISVVYGLAIEIQMSFNGCQSEEHAPQPTCLKDRLL